MIVPDGLPWMQLSDLKRKYENELFQIQREGDPEPLSRSIERTREHIARIRSRISHPDMSGDEKTSLCRQLRQAQHDYEFLNYQLIKRIRDCGLQPHWFAIGRRNRDAKEEIIPMHYWDYFEIDFANNRAYSDNLEFRAIKCLFLKDLPDKHPLQRAWWTANKLSVKRRGHEFDHFEGPVVPLHKRGRPPEGDWPIYKEELRARILTKGFPKPGNVDGWSKQADIELFLTELAERDGFSPSESNARKHAKRLLNEIRAEMENTFSDLF